MKIHLYVLFFLFFVKTAFCQQKSNIIITVPLIESIDSNFTKIVDRHIAVLESRNTSTDSTIIIKVVPYISRAQGVPQDVVDSLYAENKFPENDNIAGYSLYVTSMPFNYWGHCQIENLESLYLFEYKDKQIMIYSNLKLDFKLKGNKDVIVCGEGQLTSYPDPKFTTYYDWFWRERISEIRTFPLFDKN